MLMLKEWHDAALESPRDRERPREERLYCARCGMFVTKGAWRFRMNGGHEHVVFNPAGAVFRVQCFQEAPGAVAVGSASGAFTWFRGYDWRMALCTGCNGHLGWMYEGAGAPAVFFGLVVQALTRRDE